MVREGGPRYSHGLLDLSRRHFPPRPDQEEEDLQAGQVSEGLQRLHMRLVRLELGQPQWFSYFHIFTFTK